MIGVGRARRTVEGTFACVLVDADQKSAPGDERIGLVLKHCCKFLSPQRMPPGPSL